MSGAIAVVGAGGHGRVVADCATCLGWSSVTFFDDANGEVPDGPWTFGGRTADLLATLGDFNGVVVGIGANAARSRIQTQLSKAGAPRTTLVHPRAWVSSHAVVGDGSVVFAGAVVNIGARIGAAVIVNTGATVDHDCVLADGAHVAPGAHLAGGVSVGKESWIGVGAVVREYCTVGARVIVGAGAVVVKSFGDDMTLVGNPARPLPRRTSC